VEYVNVVQRFKSLYDLNQNAPDVFLSQVCLFSLVSGNLLEEIAIVSILHYYATGQTKMHIIEALLISSSSMPN